MHKIFCFKLTQRSLIRWVYLQFCVTDSWWHCVSGRCSGETHAGCSRVPSSLGCTCTPRRRRCTGLRCDSYTSWDNRGPSAQRDRLHQRVHRQFNSGSHSHIRWTTPHWQHELVQGIQCHLHFPQAFRLWYMNSHMCSREDVLKESIITIRYKVFLLVAVKVIKRYTSISNTVIAQSSPNDLWPTVL